MRLPRGIWAISITTLAIGISLSPCHGQEDPLPTREEIEEEMRQKEAELQRVREDLRSKRRKAAEIAGREHDILGENERINVELRLNQQLLAKLKTPI